VKGERLWFYDLVLGLNCLFGKFYWKLGVMLFCPNAALVKLVYCTLMKENDNSDKISG